MINWLHISDLHLGSEGAITNMMRDELPEYLKELGVKCDYVFCTGDIRTANVSSNVFTDEMAAIFGNRVYGCDDCQKACPHNRFARASKVKEFSPSQEFLSLSYDSLQQLSEDGFRCLFKDSAVKRTKYSGLMRNISAITRKHP